MHRRKWLWFAALALPMAVTGRLVDANSQARPYVCPITGEELPCEKCCPFNKSKAVAQKSKPQAQDQFFVCAITGEELPCEKCCPLNMTKAAVAQKSKPQARPYVCPITGEELPCEKCCPLNKSK